MRPASRHVLVAACVACAMHGGAIALMVHLAATDPAPPAALRESEWHIVPFEAQPIPRVPLPEITTPPPPAQDEPNALGEQQGTGESIAALDLPDVARSPAPHEFEQAWTRREPTFAPPPPPPAKTQPEAEAPQQKATPSESLAVPKPAPAEAEPPSLPFGTLPAKAAAPTAPATPPEASPIDSSAEAQPASAPKSSAQETEASPPRPDAKSLKADPANLGKSDLDAFAREEGIDFTSGGIKARQGREVRLVRPRVDLRFLTDATTIYARGIRVTLQIETDENGKPRHIAIAESSGSDIIDDAVRTAAYDSWFGPPVSDRFRFTVRFVR